MLLRRQLQGAGGVTAGCPADIWVGWQWLRRRSSGVREHRVCCLSVCTASTQGCSTCAPQLIVLETCLSRLGLGADSCWYCVLVRRAHCSLAGPALKQARLSKQACLEQKPLSRSAALSMCVMKHHAWHHGSAAPPGQPAALPGLPCTKWPGGCEKKGALHLRKVAPVGVFRLVWCLAAAAGAFPLPVPMCHTPTELAGAGVL